MVITPTVGRVVWYFPGPYDGVQRYDDKPCAAHVTYVHNDRMVNLVVFSHTGQIHVRNSVALIQEGDGENRPHMGWAEWMPYQQGQAKKHAAEDAAK